MNLINYLFKSLNKPNKDKYDFQGDAVEKVIQDLADNPFAKKLIVIPTGGGKTVVGLQLINKLINKGFITKDKKVLWTVHSIYLKNQTKNYLTDEKHQKLREKINLMSNLSEYLDIEMISDAKEILTNKERLKYKLLIIDEAHHSSAPSYRDFFSNHIGIIGLTATPTRLDRKELPFTGIAYSVKFSTLEKIGVITMPQIENIFTDILVTSKDLKTNKEIDRFDSVERNKFIANWIFEKRNIYKYKKLVIFTGSKNHAKNLYEELKNTNDFYNQPFQHIGYILGGNDNEQNKDNNLYLDEEKELNTSILINCEVLNEGYDDPNLDTVIMATPTNSTVYYMQCMGRVVRVPEEGKDKKAYLFEFVDKLPNISYRVDNRWLYGEIEQELLPIIYDDIIYSSKSDLHNKILNVLNKNRVSNRYINLKSIIDDDFGLLLFTDSETPNKAEWFPLLIDTTENGKAYTDAFNKLSLSIDKFAHYGPGNSINDVSGNYIINTVLGIKKGDYLFSQRLFSESFIYSLARAFYLKKNRKTNDCLKYYTFKKIKYNNFLSKYFIKIKELLTK